MRRVCVKATRPGPQTSRSRWSSNVVGSTPLAGLALCFVTVGCAFWTPQPRHNGDASVATPENAGPAVYAAAPPSEAELAWRDPSSREARSADSSAVRGGAFAPAAAPEQPTSHQNPDVDAAEAAEDAEDEIEDEVGAGQSYAGNGAPSGAAEPHPLSALSASELRRRLEHDPSSLGPMSVGAPNGGALVNSVQLPEDSRWERVSPGAAWGTRETIDYLSNAIGRVVEQYPDSLPVAIGHISERNGGPIRPHKSHQSGADVDVGYYYKPDAHKWYQRATRDNLDLPRTWALVRALITETDARMILIDQAIQGWLREYAESINEDSAWLNDVFGAKGGGRPALIRHVSGHATHLHVRFYNPIAEETARRCYADLVALGKVKVQPSFVSYKARKGDTLLALAKRFGTTVKAIKRANALRSNTILAKRVYKIPSAVKHKISLSSARVVPPRRLPPTPSSHQSLSRL